MKRTTPKPTPEHEVVIRRGKIYSTVRLFVEGRCVAVTTMKPSIRKDSAKIKRFVRQYFHLPY